MCVEDIFLRFSESMTNVKSQTDVQTLPELHNNKKSVEKQISP